MMTASRRSGNTRPCRPRSSRLLALAAGAMLLMTGGAGAHSYRLGAIQIGHLWAKPPTHGELEVLGPLFNSGTTPDQLIAAHSSVVRAVTFQRETAGKEQTLQAIDIPAGEAVSLAPWSQGIRLTGVASTVQVGSTIPLTLEFAHAGRIDVEVLVERSPTP
jgi:hypothetical protein